MWLNSDGTISKIDPVAMKQQLTWTCPHCQRDVLPLEYGGGIAGGRIFVVRRVYCDCPTAMKQLEDVKRKEKLEAGVKLLKEGGIHVYGDDANYHFNSWYPAFVPDGEKKLNGVMDYCAHVDFAKRKWMYISGDYGVGKTHLALAAQRRIAIEKQYRVQVLYWTYWATKIANEFGAKNKKHEKEFYRKAYIRGVLLIDDPDKGDLPDWLTTAFFTVMDYRSKRDLPTIITANHKLEDLEPFLLEKCKDVARDKIRAACSRLIGQVGWNIHITGKDYRKR